MELGDVQRTITIGAPLDTTALPVERQVRHAIETARALARWNRIDEALAALLDAEVIGPDQVRYHRLSRDLVREILTAPDHPGRPSNSANEWASDQEGHRAEQRYRRLDAVLAQLNDDMTDQTGRGSAA